eukprot:scaffold157519_cov32-Prasinocladus_malaysianus.AAC.3
MAVFPSRSIGKGVRHDDNSPHDEVDELVGSAADKNVLRRDPRPLSQAGPEGPALGVGVDVGEPQRPQRLPDLPATQP